MSQYVGVFSPEFYINEYMSPIPAIPAAFFRTGMLDSESLYYYIKKVDSLTEAMKTVILYVQAMPIELRTDLQIKIFSKKPNFIYGQKVKSPSELFKLELNKYEANYIKKH